MKRHTRGSNSYYKPQITEFHTFHRVLKSTDIRNERTEGVLSGQNRTVRFFRQNRTEIELKQNWKQGARPSSFNPSFSPFIIKRQKNVGEVF
jgi:hypothetical protein